MSKARHSKRILPSPELLERIPQTTQPSFREELDKLEARVDRLEDAPKPQPHKTHFWRRLIVAIAIAIITRFVVNYIWPHFEPYILQQIFSYIPDIIVPSSTADFPKEPIK